MYRPQGVVTMETIHRFKVLPITDIFPQSLMFVKTNRAQGWSIIMVWETSEGLTGDGFETHG